MSLVVTLICNPANPALDSTAVEAVRAILPSPSQADWLFDGVAADIAFASDENQRTLQNKLRHALGDLPVDVVVQPKATRRKRLFLADMDSTMIGQECIDELAAFAGLKAHVAAITERAMRGELEFEPALRERVAKLKGLALGALQRTYDERVRLNPGAATLVRTMAAHGARCVLVSGGFSFFTKRVAEAAGFHAQRANLLLDDGAALTGLVQEPVLGREAKLRALQEEAVALGLTADAALAIGDGANDLAMIKAAGLGIAYRAKPIVATEARARIEHTGLETALFLQGYHRSEFAQ